MKSHLTQEISEGLYILLISEENQAKSAAWLSEHFGLTLPEKAAENGAKSLLFAAKNPILLLGVGANPSLENLRKNACKAVAFANEYKHKSLSIVAEDLWSSENTEALAEAIWLSNYQFLKYKTEAKENSLKHFYFWAKGAEIEKSLQNAKHIAEVTCIARDLVNEPVITLTAKELALRAEKLGEKYGYKSEIFNKTKIKTLKMGGLLAVNSGSQEPPTFTILEYKPKKAKNKKPIILVGKGVVYDTGGLSLKPTPNSMDSMKCDMAGAAAVISAIAGAAALNLPLHIMALVPATDNRPGENAYTPGDVITMYDGTKIEVLNTDAEGRMILADALAYAKQFQPELVIDLATLTGASVVAIGSQGVAMMGTAPEVVKQQLKQAGEKVYERIVEFPLWDEYGELIKSDIADMKNIGGSGAGAITAGKFLQHFTAYPWIHFDIAGAAFLSAPDHYRGKNGTGVGVRLLLEFLRRYE